MTKVGQDAITVLAVILKKANVTERNTVVMGAMKVWKLAAVSMDKYLYSIKR